MNRAFPVRVAKRGFAVHPNGIRGQLTYAYNDPLATTDPHALVFHWGQPFRLAAIDPWPRVKLTWSGGVVLLAPATALGILSPLPFERGAEQALRAIAEHVPQQVDLGWLELPVVEWERVSGLPALPDTTGAAKGAAYRSGSPRAEELAVAARGAPSAMEVMLDWLASTPERTWRDHPREVRLTDDAVFVRRRGGECVRLPLESLRARVGPKDEDAVYVFGRRTRLVLTHQGAPCPVREALDQRLLAAE